MRLGIVVVAYRSADTIADCLNGILIDPNVSSIVVVDNSRDPATKQVIIRQFPDETRIEYVAGPNVGFAAGCNLGAGLAGECDYLGFVNPDLFLTSPIGELATELARSGAAIVSARTHVLSVGNARNIGSHGSHGVSVARELARATIGLNRAYRYNRSFTSTRAVDALAGALLVMRRDTFFTLGGFDERFNLYYDDVDLCHRAKEFGGCVISPALVGTHLGGHSARSDFGRSYLCLRVNGVRYLRKHRVGGLMWRPLAFATALVEFVCRSLGGTREGRRTRWFVLRQQLREIVRESSYSTLEIPIPR